MSLSTQVAPGLGPLTFTIITGAIYDHYGSVVSHPSTESPLAPDGQWQCYHTIINVVFVCVTLGI
jgi:hypothetical protein